ncbi:hypothetical protein SIO70_30385 [Chitinophaga sancti]|uniref:hypothetical protein n=1 Tax=Chitinophaga sancti TaxID=1004 RepID=UPI002A74C152|nr:hypothetical protein [Chitinophaga sancti]WPQ62670.1 hypothetical protein SIO70_30385 [Chitinophaga sancti]
MKPKTISRSICRTDIIVLFYPILVIVKIYITGVLNAQHWPVSNTTNTIGGHVSDDVIFTDMVIL